jgi:hypothetical protein
MKSGGNIQMYILKIGTIHYFYLNFMAEYMRNFTKMIWLPMLVLFSDVLEAQPEKGRIDLFNGKDLSNWVFVLKNKTVDPAKVFTVKEGVIHISGDPFGYMRTKKEYADYKLHVEWRWPVEATNSGVFFHVQPPDTVWPVCFESQLMAGNAGDLICMGGSDVAEHTDKSSIVIRKLQDSNENPVGEWNVMEVICRRNVIEVYVNGTLQNRATGATLSRGSICLQSEGKDIEFRNVFLVRF